MLAVSQLPGDWTRARGSPEVVVTEPLRDQSIDLIGEVFNLDGTET